MPNDNIDRALRRGAGLEAGGAAYESITYEGYAPGGVAVLSGLLGSQEKQVLAAHTMQGLKLEKRFPHKEWCTLVLKG